MKKKIKEFIARILVMGIIITVFPSITAEAADMRELKKDKITEIISSYMNGRECAVVNGDMEELENIAVSGIVKDETVHRELLHDNEIDILHMSYCIKTMDIEDAMINVLLDEKIEYILNGDKKTEDVEHNLVIMYDEAGNAKIVSDSYIDCITDFQSCSYVDETDEDISLLSSSSAIVEIAESQVGYKEKSSDSNLDDFTANAGTANYTKYGKWYGLNPAPWCAIFVSWCANEAKISTSVIPKYSSCSTGMSTFKEWKRFYYSSAYGGSYTPKVGDIFFVGTSTTSSTHTGIVVGVSSSQITVVDGNYSDKVSKHTYSLTNSSLIGFANPAY